MGDRVSALLADYGGGQSQPKRSRVQELLDQSDDSGDQVEAAKTHEPDFVSYKAPDVAPAPAPEGDLLERFLNGAGEAAHDASAAIKPYGDALHEFVDPHGHMDMGADFSRGAKLRDIADSAAAHERSPVSSTIADVAATLPVAAVAGPAAGGAAIGAIDSAANDEDWKHQLLHAFIGGTGGAALHGLGAGIEATGNNAGRLEQVASRQRVAAAVGGGAMVKKIAGEIGDEGVTRLGNDIESRGLHEGTGPLGVASTEDYLNNANKLIDKANATHGGVATLADIRGVQVPMTDTIGQLRSQANNADSRWSQAGKPQADFMRGEAARIQRGTTETLHDLPTTSMDAYEAAATPWAALTPSERASMTPAEQRGMRQAEQNQTYSAHNLDPIEQPGGEPPARPLRPVGSAPSAEYTSPFGEALGQRQSYDQEVRYGSQNPGQRIPHQDATNRFLANNIRGGLQSSLDEQAPDLAGPWRDSSRDLTVGLSVANPAESKVFQEAGHAPVPLSAWLGVASGNPVAAGAAHLATQYGRSALAGATRGAQHVAERFDTPAMNTLSEFLQGSGAGAAAGAVGGVGTQPTATQAMQESRGHELPNVINKMLQDPQQAQRLGEYRAQFENAGRTAGGIEALLNKLNRDQKWRQTILLELQQLTGDSTQ
jgi:hypothetical protein